MKKYTLIVFYNIIAVIFLFLLLEVGVRLFVPQIRLPGTSSDLIIDSLYNDSPGIKSDTEGCSGGVIKKSNGYHSWKYFKPVSTGTVKLLFLGDSVTMGISVENDSTFAGIINNSIHGMNVINPSLIGYSSKDYLNVFNYFIIKNEYKLNFSSVIMFWTLNDIYSNYPDNKSPEYDSPGVLNEIIGFLRRTSKSYQFLKNIISDRPKAYYEYDRQFYNNSSSLLLKSIEKIKRISATCDSLNIKFQLILLPYEYQLRNSSRQGIFHPQNLLKEKLADTNIEIIDLRQVFSNVSERSNEFYLYGDGIHFNERGNSLIAFYLKKIL